MDEEIIENISFGYGIKEKCTTVGLVRGINVRRYFSQGEDVGFLVETDQVGDCGKVYEIHGESRFLSNYNELARFKLNHGITTLYPSETIELIREMFGNNPNIYLDMKNGPQDVEGIMSFGSGYNSISPIPTEKDFFVTPLYLPDPLNPEGEGHFVTGVFKKTNNIRKPYELYIFDSNGFNDGKIYLGTESYLPDGRKINIQAKTLNTCNLQMNSDTCPYYTLVSCDILSSFPNFESLQQYCTEQQQIFAKQNTNDIDQQVANFLSLHGMTSEVFAEFKANGSQFRLPGVAGRAIDRLNTSHSPKTRYLDAFKGIRAKTTDDIKKDNKQQTNLTRLQQQRKRSNSLPNRPISIV